MGIPGVGKTTIVDLLASLIRESKLVTFGSMMLEQGLKLKWIKDRDQLRKLPVEKQRRLQTAAAVGISKMKEKTVIIDTHLFIRTKEGYWPGLPFEVVRALRPTHLVLVEASQEEITARRASDRSRYRDSVSHEGLLQEITLAREFLSVSSALTGAPMLIVDNKEGKSKEVAAGIAKMIREAAS